MVRILIVAIIVAASFSAGSSYYIVDSLSGEVANARNQSIAQMRRVETDFNAADQEILSQVRELSSSTDNYANEFRNNRAYYLADREAVAANINSIADRIEAIEERSVEVLTTLDQHTQGLDMSESSIENLRDIMSEFNTDLAELEAQITALEAIQSASPEEVFENAISSIQPCSVIPLNKQAQLRPLQRTLSQSNHVGMHNVVVRYDVTTEGATVLKGLQSDTAPSKLMSAVSRYVNGLKFNSQEQALTNCEMVVRLDNSRPQF